MNRRNVLLNAAKLPFLSFFIPVLFGKQEVAHAQQTKLRVRPWDSSWPNAARWAELKDAVGGNLLEVRPLFESCQAGQNSPGCLDALRNIRNPYWIGDQPAGTQVSGWVEAWKPVPSAYAVKVRSVADIVASLTFARKHNLMVAIKGGGHSYHGTSSAPDSLLIWTRAMNAITLHEGFVGKNCEGRIPPVPAVSAEAGALWMDLYNAVTAKSGRYVQGGGRMTVGVGGLVQSGGFGIFSKRFGTAAASLLEAEIVTADGEVRIANACTNSDLFWALKGGGGGTFGVVSRLTLRTHDLPKIFGYMEATVKAESEAAFAQLIEYFVDFYRENLFNPTWGEQVRLGPDNTLEISMVSQGLELQKAREVLRPFFDWVHASPGKLALISGPNARAKNPRNWWAVAGNPNMERDTRDGAPADRGWSKGDQGEVGALLHGYDSVWLPAALLQKSHTKYLTAALFAASRHKLVRRFLNKGLAGAPAEVLQRSVRPQ
jgi:hypothetical protein